MTEISDTLKPVTTMLSRSRPSLTISLRVGVIALLCVETSSAFAAVEFTRDIEPILIKRCSECHGPDKQKSNLRLDSRAAAIKAGKSGELALVPGKPEASELINRVTASDPDDVMPPKGARLTDREVAALRQWIQEGAIWPEVDARRHWSFIKPTRPVVPAVSHERWART